MKVYGVDCVIRLFEGMEGSRGEGPRVSASACRISKTIANGCSTAGSAERAGRSAPARSKGVQVADQAAPEDLSGQRWSPDGALDVLWVRALIIDGLHNEYWKGRRNRKGVRRKPAFAA